MNEIGYTLERFKTSLTQDELASRTNEKDEPILVAIQSATLLVIKHWRNMKPSSGTILITITLIKSSKNLTKTTKKI